MGITRNKTVCLVSVLLLSLLISTVVMADNKADYTHNSFNINSYTELVSKNVTTPLSNYTREE